MASSSSNERKGNERYPRSSTHFWAPFVFGESSPLRRARDAIFPRPHLADRDSTATQPRADMDTHVARLRIQRALRHNVPSAAIVSHNTGDKVLAWGESLISQRIGE